MKKKALVVTCCISLLLAAGACKKKEEKPPVPQTGMPGQQQMMPPGQQALPPGHGMMPKGQTTVIVPDTVKGKWKAVTLIIENKETKKKDEITVNLNSETMIPNSNLKIAVGDFLPDFKMEGLNITSISNEPNNPAVNIKVFEKDKEIFKGWLYVKFPTIHPFEHPKYSILLKQGIKKG